MNFEVSVNDLVPHPQNAAIYGEEDVSELAERIAASNWIKPLVVNAANKRIISGHRRWLAARQLSLQRVPVEYRAFENENDELEALLLENANRDKTPEQKVREADVWEHIEGAKAKARQLSSLKQNQTVEPTLAQRDTGRSSEKAATKVGMKKSTYKKAKKVVATADALKEAGQTEAAASLLKKLNQGSVDAAYKATVQNQRQQAFQEAPLVSVVNVPLFISDIRDGLPLEPESVDLILTDPPYPNEYLSLYEMLAMEAARVLKPGGSLAMMCGQSYLPDIFRLMEHQLTYQWTFAYLTPGGQSSQLWDRKVNTFWKPVLWFVKGEYAGGWKGDVTKSRTNDNDKRFHDWGQSESGMADLVERFSEPGDLILDPFMGAGTTGIAAVALKRRFIGCDLDASCIDLAQKRIALCVIKTA